MPAAIGLDDYRAVAPRGTVDFLARMGARLHGRRVVHVSGSRYSGVFVEVLNRLVPVMNEFGVDTTWEVMVGPADFEAGTNALRVALAGGESALTETMLARVRAVCADNAAHLPLDGDLVVAHEAAPLLLIEHRPPKGRWLWRSHGDLKRPVPRVWAYARPAIERYDGAVFSLASFAAPLSIPRYLMAPSIDPLSERNRELPRSEVTARLRRLGVPTDKPYLLQVGPFAAAQDPLGVVGAFRLVRRHHDVRLVLAGSDAPAPGSLRAELQEIAARDPDLHLVSLDPDPAPALNALERGAAIVVQKPLQTDFCLHVASAMWKGKPVVGSEAGGIPSQIVHGATGYTVDTVEGAAFRIRHLLSNPEQITRMGALGREWVRREFLITRHLAAYLGLLAHLTR